MIVQWKAGSASWRCLQDDGLEKIQNFASLQNEINSANVSKLERMYKGMCYKLNVRF